MTAPTVPVTINLADLGGPAISGVTVTAKMSDWDISTGDVFVSAKPVTGVTDVTGTVVLELFPNAMAPDGLGTRGTLMRVTARPTGGKKIDVNASIPNVACNLADVVEIDESAGLSAAQIALAQVQGSRAAAAASAAAAAHIYGGLYDSDPTTRPDGSPVQEGDEYFNDTQKLVKHWDGATWVASDINTANLAASGGSSLVGFLPSGSGAQARTAEDKLRERFSFFDRFTPAEKADALSGAPVLDHTASMQSAINAAPAGATILGTPGATFNFTNLTTSKALTLDFQGASLIVDPTPVGVTTGTPAIRFAGTVGAGYALNTKADLTSNVVCTTAADAANFAAGDWVVIEDNTIVQKWDASVGAYNGRGQITRVSASNPATGAITLANAVEHLYQAASGFIYKVTPVQGPKVLGIGSIREVDPGGITTGGVGIGAPHLIEFAYCVRPKVSAVSAEGWNLFVVHFGYCVQPSMKRVHGYKPFRPANGGHGYLQRFYRCSGGVAKNNRGERCRHVIDFTNTYDCISENNLGVDTDPDGVSYLWHGLAEKRCRSVHDTHLGETIRANCSIGWSVGNTAFSAAYDAMIDSPVYRGGAGGVVVRSLVQGCQITDPDFKIVDTSGSGPRGVAVREGADKVQISGGVIDCADAGAITGSPILINDTSGVLTGDVIVRGTRLIAPNVGGEAVNASHTGGGLAVIDCAEVTGTDAARNAISITSTLTWLQVSGNRIGGTWSRGVKTAAAPSGSYVVTNNADDGTFSQFVDLATGANLVNFFNGPGSAALTLTAAAGTARQLIYSTGNTLRWILRANNTAEAGANSGSDFEMVRRDDTGANLGLSIRVVRSTGQTEFEAGDDFTRPLKLGTRGFLWVDSTTRLRIKATSPTSDTDGTVIGTQL